MLEQTPEPSSPQPTPPAPPVDHTVLNDVLSKIGELLSSVPQFQSQAEQVKALLSKNIPKPKDFDAQLQTLQARIGSTKKKLESVRGEKDRLQTSLAECVASEQKLDQELKALAKDRDNLLAHAPPASPVDVTDDRDEAGDDEEMPETLPAPLDAPRRSGPTDFAAIPIRTSPPANCQTRLR
jgi:hypothetical protein